VIRDPVTGEIVTVVGNFENQAKTEVKGIDLDARYAMSTDIGKFTGRVNWTYFDSFKENDVEVVGSNAGTNTIPRAKGVVGLDWDYRAFSATVNMNYTHGYHQTAASLASYMVPQDPQFQNGVYHGESASLPDRGSSTPATTSTRTSRSTLVRQRRGQDAPVRSRLQHDEPVRLQPVRHPRPPVAPRLEVHDVSPYLAGLRPRDRETDGTRRLQPAGSFLCPRFEVRPPSDKITAMASGTLRTAREADLPAIVAIYNAAIPAARPRPTPSP
jgi:hypothetical protein